MGNIKKDLQQTGRRNILKTIAATGALAIGSQLGATSSGMKEQSFASNLLDFIKKANIDEVVKVVKFDLKSEDLPWKKELFDVKKGDQVTFFLDGKWWFSKPHNIWVEPGFVFHAKVADADYYNAGNNTGTMIAPKNGSIKIARSLGEFYTPQGNLMYPIDVYKKSQGYVEGVAIHWKGDALDGLYKLSSKGDYEGVVFREINRQVYVPPHPKGWHDIFLFATKGMFFQTGKREISCITHKNVGILQKDVDIPLSDNLKFSWDWMVEKLPSKLPETSSGTHDYLSIAVKFDDGQDLTFMWSSSLANELVFRCPLDGWNKIETHLVQRSGTKDLGKWLSESRKIKADYTKNIGGKAKKIVQVWFIGVSLFKRGMGKCKYANIEFEDNGKKTIVL